MYGKPKYSPDLRNNYAIEAFTTVKATLVEPLREHNKNGIYEATMMYTTQNNGNQGASGYFGVQWKGVSWSKDMLLFSIWDKKSGSTVTSYALPDDKIISLFKRKSDDKACNLDNDNIPTLVEGDATFGCTWNTLGNCTCRSFDVKSYEFGGFTFQTGPGYDPHWDDVRLKSNMYWTEGGQQHARDGKNCYLIQ